MALSTVEALSLPEESREHLRDYLRHLKKTFPQNLETVILFGSTVRGDFLEGRSNINLLVVLDTMSLAALQQASALQVKGGKHNIVAPLLTTRKELHRWCSVYPLELILLKDQYVFLEGRDPLPELHVPLDHVGWHCEREVISHGVQVRQRFMEGEGRVEAVQAILILSITSLLPVIRGILHVLNHSPRGSDREILEQLPHTLGCRGTGLMGALQVKRGLSSPGVFEWFKVYEGYLESLSELATRVRMLRQEKRL